MREPIVFFLPFSSIALSCGWLSDLARCVLRAAKPPHAKAMGSIFVALMQCYILGFGGRLLLATETSLPDPV